ncbi:extracellular solute-binding protein [Blautia sp. MSJ-19]|nr:extracellular solute-binding protein [Blautia sp. MSJ-19]
MLAGTLTGCTVGGTKNAEPVTLTVWTYYSGEQLDAFNDLVNSFNDSVGKEKNIIVESSSQGSVNELETNVMDAAEEKVGASDMPNIFSAYADTAYKLDEMGELVDLSGYLTDEEKDAYIDAYLKEGDFSGDGSIKIFPVAKSTELLFLNKTDWQKFADATGATEADLETVEGLVETAEKYYNWTDEQTEEPDDGKALFGRDAMANYMLVGARQLGGNLFEVENGKMKLNFDKDVVRKLWDNYYVPYVKGYFAASGRFRSDDIKTGNILAYAGSTSSATFFPKQVMTSETESHDIELEVLPAPEFADGEKWAVQQGAGMVVTKGSEDEIKASVEFLKWITEPENNTGFSVGSGYLPVTKEATDMVEIRKSGTELSKSMDDILTKAVETINNNELYTTPSFKGAQDSRALLEYEMNDLADADRQTVEERISEGESMEEAVADFVSDDYFDSWYEEILTKLQACED